MNYKKKLSTGGLLIQFLISGSLVLAQHGDTYAQDPLSPLGLLQDQSSVAEERPHAVQSEMLGQIQDTTPGQVSPPAPRLEPEIRARLNQLLNTSSEGLVEEKMNGAVRLNLRGRFRTAPVANINEEGELEIVDYMHLPPEQ